jgi:hypothetical protein
MDSLSATGIPIDVLLYGFGGLASLLGGLAWNTVAKRLDSLEGKSDTRDRQLTRIMVKLGIDPGASES